jgi:hypothetical protein
VDRFVMPVLGNLAWAPYADTDRVEILDRFNGVPTLGVLTTRAGGHLFWRAAGYVSSFSLWIYVPLIPADCTRLRECDDSALLNGLVFQSPGQRYVTVGLAENNRLMFEREWVLPGSATERQLMRDLLSFLLEALTVALEQDLPACRREIVGRASRAVHELALSGNA